MTTEATRFPGFSSASMPSQDLSNYQSLSDLELTKLSGQQDMVAFEFLYQRHHRRVYSLCLRMLQNTHEAEDLTQDVFIQLYRKVHTFQGHSEFTTWLHRLTTNQVLMHFRKLNNQNGAKKLIFMDSSELPELTVLGTSDLKKMSVDQKIALVAAIAQLPKGYKNVFVLHDIAGYEHEEVAKILGVTSGTTKSQLSKARLKMRKLLKQIVNPRLVTGV